MKLRLSTLIAIALSVSAFAADVNGSPSTASTSLAEQRLRQDMQLLLSRMSASGMLGDHPEQVHMSIDEPSRRIADLGVLVDSTSAERAHDGLRILGTTPGGSAEHGGLRSGDVIVAVNGTSLKNLGADSDGRALAAATLRSSVNDAAPTTLQLNVVRNGDQLAMSVPVQSVFVPALRVELGSVSSAAQTTVSSSSGCGRISTYDVAPRSERIYHATIQQIDGVTPGSSGQEDYRVSAGPHKLLVNEDIPTRQVGIGPDATMRSQRDHSKVLLVDIKPDTTVMIGAKFHQDKANSVRNGEYWDPIAWREKSMSCP
jgi:PDZ domain